MTRSSGRGSRTPIRPGDLLLSRGAESLAELTGRTPQDAQLMIFNAFEARNGRDATATMLKAHNRVVEALDATVVKRLVVANEVQEFVDVDHRTRLEARNILFEQVGLSAGPASRGSGGNILLQINLPGAEGWAPNKPDPRPVGPGVGGGGS